MPCLPAWDQGEFDRCLLNPVRAQFIAACGTRGARALDVGCGGLLTEALTRAGAQVTGIDLAPGMIEVARLHAAESGLAIDYRIAAAEELARSSPQGFEVVTCMERLEHVPEPAATVASLAALLRPGGALFPTLNSQPAPVPHRDRGRRACAAALIRAAPTSTSA